MVVHPVIRLLLERICSRIRRAEIRMPFIKWQSYWSAWLKNVSVLGELSCKQSITYPTWSQTCITMSTAQNPPFILIQS